MTNIQLGLDLLWGKKTPSSCCFTEITDFKYSRNLDYLDSDKQVCTYAQFWRVS